MFALRILFSILFSDASIRVLDFGLIRFGVKLGFKGVKTTGSASYYYLSLLCEVCAGLKVSLLRNTL